ncbi:MAG: hypothetical protein QM673_16620 [Gordonia sp. (in: high G+C Gram-positive bacteria)]
MSTTPKTAQPISVTVRSRPLTCLACGEGTKFWLREAAIDPRRPVLSGAAFSGGADDVWDEQVRSATCDICGYVHIFRTRKH